MWLDFRALQLADRALHALLVERARVALSPGSSFGEGGAGFMRINLGAPRATVMEALSRVAAVLPAQA
jgi:cystathionine beta-lyase